MEKASLRALLPLEGEWNDKGSLEHFLCTPSQPGFAEPVQDWVGEKAGYVVEVEGERNLLHAAPGVTLATLGLSEIAVIATGDATLVARRDALQNMQPLLEKIRQVNPAALHKADRNLSPWGAQQIVLRIPGCCIKLIEVEPGQRLSLQQHQHRDELWMLLTGSGRITLGEQQWLLQPHESVTIPRMVLHRLENEGDTPLKLIEIQTGDVLDEGDIIRHEDDYGRLAV